MVTIPRKNDVLFGKGNAINMHSGNIHFRSLVEPYKMKFKETNKKNKKRTMAIEIVNKIQNVEGGRFLMEDTTNNAKGRCSNKVSIEEGSDVNAAVHPIILAKMWICAENHVVLAKVMHRLREKNKSKGDQQQPMQRKKMENDTTKKEKGGSDLFDSNNTPKEPETVDLMMSQLLGTDGDQQETSGVIPRKSGQTLDCNKTKELEIVEGPDLDENEISFILQGNCDELDDSFDQLSDELNASFDHLSEVGDYGAVAGEQHRQEKQVIQPASFNPDQPDALSNNGNDLQVQVEGSIHLNLDTSEDAKMASSNLKMDGLGEELDLDDFISDNCFVHEGTMWDWIERSKPKFNPDNVLGYVKSTLPIALKLTQCLIEAEKEEHENYGGERNNPIPLASIAPKNVLIRAKELHALADFSNGFVDDPSAVDVRETNQAEEIVDYVSIMSCLGDDSDSGGAMPRLAALGLVLYTLFSGEEPPFEEESVSPNFFLSVNSISLNNDGETNHPPRKKSQRSQDMFSKCITRLKCTEVPASIFSLVRNLLACTEGDSRIDEAYSSLTDVLSDLKIMIDDPEIFVHDIETNPLPPLLIPDKHYGREYEMEKLKRSYQNHINGHCGGAIITGKAGVGKSYLAMHIQELVSKSDGYFLCAKYDQSQDCFPLTTISALFNCYIEIFSRDASDAQLKMVNEALESALGVQAGFLLGILPSLAQLMPSTSALGNSICIDSAMSIVFLFCELLRVISSHTSRHISFFLDDLQWADPISLLLIGSLITSNEESKLVFFACAYRDDEVKENDAFNQWLYSMSALSLETIKLENISVNGVNMLLADALHACPRLTLPLASVLRHKSGGGNPLFLRQLIESLKEKSSLFWIDLSYPKWDWDLDTIRSLKISDDVVSLLIEEFERLHPDLQQGLKMASCIGIMKTSILAILSKDIGQNWQETLQQLSEKGFMNNVDGTMFSFTHDKIQQAAYESMTEDQRRTNHMRFGLAICAHSGVENDDHFFTSINQMNRGGPNSLSDPSQRNMIAALNLKAGRRAISLADYNSGLKLFEQGISFLLDDHWTKNYELSINLFDAAAEAACITNKSEKVKLYAQDVLENAKCSDDKLICLYVTTKSMNHAEIKEDSMRTSFELLKQLGEETLKPMGDTQLIADIHAMNQILGQTTDDTILEIAETKEAKFSTLMKIYMHLIYLFHFRNPKLIAAASLRMVELILKHGYCLTTPIAFMYYGEMLSSLENYDLAIRLGRLALKLLEKYKTIRYKSQVSAVYHTISWLNTSFQSIIDFHDIGYTAGIKVGDALHSAMNAGLALSTSYVSGTSLNDARKKCRELTLKLLRDNTVFIVDTLSLMHLQFCVLIEGLKRLEDDTIDNIPGKAHIVAKAKKASDSHLSLMILIHHRVRTVLFRLDVVTLNVSISDVLAAKKVPLRPVFLFAIFFEGLVCFQIARQAEDEDSSKWIARGRSILSKFKLLNEYCVWNYENKCYLLEAEDMSVLGEHERAEVLYMKSIKSAHDHKFVHEEAIASELAGLSLYRRGIKRKSHSFFAHAVKCFNEWGAIAVSKRVEKSMQAMFGSNATQIWPIEDSLASFLSSKDGSSKKRQDMS